MNQKDLGKLIEDLTHVRGLYDLSASAAINAEMATFCGQCLDLMQPHLPEYQQRKLPLRWDRYLASKDGGPLLQLITNDDALEFIQAALDALGRLTVDLRQLKEPDQDALRDLLHWHPDPQIPDKNR